MRWHPGSGSARLPGVPGDRDADGSADVINNPAVGNPSGEVIFSLSPSQPGAGGDRMGLPGWSPDRPPEPLSVARCDSAAAHVVEARLGGREVEHAAGDADLARTLAGQWRGGLRVGRVAGRLRGIRMQMAAWPEVPETRAWVAGYDMAVAAESAGLGWRGGCAGGWR